MMNVVEDPMSVVEGEGTEMYGRFKRRSVDHYRIVECDIERRDDMGLRLRREMERRSSKDPSKVKLLKRDVGEIIDYFCHIYFYNLDKNKRLNGDGNRMRIDTKLLKDSFGFYYNLVLDSLAGIGALVKEDDHMHIQLKNGGSYGKCRLYRLNLDYKVRVENSDILTKDNRFLRNLLDYGGNDDQRKKRLYRFKKVAEQQTRIIKEDVKIDVDRDLREGYDDQVKASIDVINNKDIEEIEWTTDTFMSRTYTPVTRLPGAIRDRITIEGEKCVRVDIKNSIPQHMVRYLDGTIEMDPEFKDLVRENRIYERISEYTGKERKEAKLTFFRALFGPPRYMGGKVVNRNALLLGGLFPVLFEHLDNIKRKKGYNFVSSMIFNVESDNLLSVVERLFEENVKVLTVHDEFIVKRSEKKKVIDELERLGLDYVTK